MAKKRFSFIIDKRCGLIIYWSECRMIVIMRAMEHGAFFF